MFLGLFITGLVLIALAWVFISVAPQMQAGLHEGESPFAISSDLQTNEAALVIQPGGRVEYMNEAARAYFNLHEDEPYDLEKLARQTRPSEVFLSLCAAPGSKRVTLSGKLIEVTSFQAPGAYPVMLVSLRDKELSPALERGADAPDEFFRIISEFTGKVSAQLDLPSTLRSILEYIDHLIPSDILELKVWDVKTQQFASIHTFTPEGLVAEVKNSQFGGLTQQLLEREVSLLIADSQIQPELTSSGELRSVRSYLGVKLIAGGEMIGVIEAGQIGSNNFSSHELELLQFVATQTAVALRNATLYEEEQKRAAELAGLADLNQSLGVIREIQDLYTRLVQSIAPLFDADIIGFLLYDEEKHTLEGKNPFRGLPAQIVEIYRATIPAGSAAEQLILSQKAIVASNAGADETWRTLGLNDVAVAASLRENALIPLVSSGRMLGYLQLGHHTRGNTAFTAEELRLMNIVANQAAAIIENVLLVQQARARAYRADALRRIASLSGSSATIEEILKYSMQEMANLFQADSGAVFLLDEDRGELHLQLESIYGIVEGIDPSFLQIFIADPSYRFTVSGSQKAFVSGRLSMDRRVLSVYRPLATVLQNESVMVVPLTARNKSIGELMLGSRKPDFFNEYDLQLVSSAAGQLATAIESANLLNQTDDALRRRVDQLAGLNRLSKELGASLDIHHLLQVMQNESLRILHANSASIIVIEQGSDLSAPVILHATGSSTPQAFSQRELTALRKNEMQVVAEYANGSPIPPEAFAAALIVPITHQGEKIGLLNLQTVSPNFFNLETAEFAQAFAIQAGISLSTAQRYQSERQRAELMRRRADTLVRLTDVSYHISYDQPLENVLNLIASGIRNATPFNIVLMSILEPDTGLLRRITAVGIPQESMSETLTRKQPLEVVQQSMKPEFKISRSYFIPADQTPIPTSDLHVVTSDPTLSGNYSEIWNIDDALLVPLEGTDEQIIGVINLDNPKDGLRPDRATIEAIEVFASQASLIINNAARQSELRSKIDSLSSGLQRQQKLLKLTQNDLPILLRKDLEQTISLHNLDRRTQRVRAGLAITESVSRQLDAASALAALGRETLTQLGMAVALVAENTPEGPRLLHVLGSFPRATNVEALFGQRNPLRATLQNGQAILIPNLDDSDEWRDASMLTSLRAKALICLPVIVENKPIAAMLALSPETMPAFTDEDRQVYFQIAQQTSLILQNISLLSQTKRRLDEVNLLLDFSRLLYGLDPDSMVHALLDSARKVLPHAHAGLVLIWNQQSEVLIPRAVSGYADSSAMSRINYHAGEALPGIVFASKSARRVDEINFTRDYNLSAENLALYRQATGGRLPVSSLFVPVIAGEQPIGLLVLDNFNTTSAFRPDDESLLLSLAQQVALSLENVRLVQTTQERAGQLQALNTAASLTSSLSSDQLINALLDHLTPILPYDTATLWLRDKDRLTVSSTRGFSDTEQRLGLSVSVADSSLFKEMAQTGQPILINDVREDSRFVPVEAPRLSWLGIPLISKGELVGALAVEKWQAHYYSREQMQVGLTFASQSAVSLDNARLYEDSVSRATELDERSQRLATLNRFSSGLNGLLDADQILALTAEELFKGMGLKRVSVVTFERGRAIWKLSTPRPRLKLPRELPNAPIFSRLRESLGIFSTDDARNEPDLAPLFDLLGDSTTALLILPLVSGQNLNALIFVQMTNVGRFSINEVELAKTISNQAAIALENARLYQSSVRTAERFAVLNETSSQLNASLDSEEIYASAHRAAERLVPLEFFLITLLDQEKNEIEPVYLVDRGKRFPGERIPFGKGLSSEVIQTGRPVLISSSMEAEQMNTVHLGDPDNEVTQSVMAVPMMLGGKPLGMLSAQSYQPGAYTDEDVQILGTFANQAIVAIQNGRLFAETQNLASQMEARVVERTAQLRREQQNTETLLRILTEVSSSLDLDRALNRTLSLLNDAIGADQGTIMLVHAEDNLLHYRAGYGYLTDQTGGGSRGFTLKIGQGLAGWVVQNREAALIRDLHQDPRWVRSANSGQDHRSAMAVPMMVGEDVIGVLMVYQRAENFFSAEMLNLVKAIAGQVAVAINNAHLYELIRDQAERLGVMLRKEQEEASRSTAILEAVADGVLVTGSDNRITFVNTSAEKVIALDKAKLLDSPLEAFAGLFGQAAGTWMDTIRRWSEDPSAHQEGESYAEQVELGNGRVLLVHLAPVILQNDFLGTVSIFRDITHEVEVDRLKSEFVATVSHELRTPMTAIKGYVDILIMGATGALNENQAHFLQIVDNNINRLNILVDDLLDISRIESGRITLNPQPVDLRELTEEVLQDVMRRSQNENKPMAVSLDAPKKIPPVVGDTQRVRQIIGNLVDNAYNYTPQNGIIRVGIHQVNGDVQVDVQDNGVGVDPADQDRLFERFFRGEHPLVLATPGTGLGLPIVRQLVEMHNGRIWMTSAGVPGEGSVFSFTLPLHK